MDSIIRSLADSIPFTASPITEVPVRLFTKHDNPIASAYLRSLITSGDARCYVGPSCMPWKVLHEDTFPVTIQDDYIVLDTRRTVQDTDIIYLYGKNTLGTFGMGTPFSGTNIQFIKEHK